jgi:hypothetical protein
MARGFKLPGPARQGSFNHEEREEREGEPNLGAVSAGDSAQYVFVERIAV